MYRFKEVRLKNKQQEKIVLVMDFHDPQMAIVTEFFNESDLFLQDVLAKITEIKIGEITEADMSGNRCHLQITQNKVIFHDLFEELFKDALVFDAYEMETSLLKQLIHAYLNKQTEIKQKNHES